MDIVTQWAATKGMDLLAEEVMEWLAVDSFDPRKVMNSLEGKLDRILGAPYKEALIYLTEGDIENCRKRIVSALALDELDLPARLLYAKMLAYDKKFDLSLSQYLEILKNFGFHPGLVPSALLREYASKYFECCVFSREFSLQALPDRCKHRIWCSPSGFLIRYWDLQGTMPWEPSNGVLAFHWDGRPIHIQEDGGFADVVTVTERYFVLLSSNGNYQVHSFSNGRVVRSLSCEECKTLFYLQDAEALSSEGSACFGDCMLFVSSVFGPIQRRRFMSDRFPFKLWVEKLERGRAYQGYFYKMKYLGKNLVPSRYRLAAARKSC